MDERDYASLNEAMHKIERIRDKAERSEHHYSDVIESDLAEALNTLGNALDAIKEIADGCL